MCIRDSNPTYRDGSEYPGLSSGSNNYAPSNPALTEPVEADLENFLAKNPDVKREDIPTDLLTASGSGLDPHISPASAEVQAVSYTHLAPSGRPGRPPSAPIIWNC